MQGNADAVISASERTARPYGRTDMSMVAPGAARLVNDEIHALPPPAASPHQTHPYRRLGSRQASSNTREGKPAVTILDFVHAVDQICT